MGRKANRHCGADLHESNIVAAIVDREDSIVGEQIFKNDVEGHMDAVKWLKMNDCRHVGMESTGVYWKAFAQTLVSFGIKVKVGNAEQMKNVPGNKTDKLDARRIARLLRDGYIPESNILSKESDDFRTMVRTRLRLVKERTATKNRISALIAKSGFRLKCSDKFGRLGCQILNAIAKGKPLDEVFKSKQAVKLGYSTDEFISLLETHITQPVRQQLDIWLTLLDELTTKIDKVEKIISAIVNNDKAKLKQFEIIKSTPGFADIASPIVLAEIEEISCFPTADCFSAYCGLVPTVYQSGEKMIEGETVNKVVMGRLRTRCNKRLKWIFVEAAKVVAKLPESPLVKPLRTFYRRILRRNSGRYGKEKAVAALAHKLAKIIWTLLTKGERYHGNGNVEKVVMNSPKVRKDDKIASAPLLNRVHSVLIKANRKLDSSSLNKNLELIDRLRYNSDC